MKELKLLICGFLCSFAVAACGGGEPPSEPATPDASSPEPARSDATTVEVEGNPEAEQAATEITADYMRRHIVELSSDKYQGRGPGSKGDEMARAYLVEELKRLGLEPGAEDGDYQQEFALVGVSAEQPPEWTFKSGEEELVLQQWDQFIAASGVQADRAEIKDAELVFVGYGIQAPEYDWDDYAGVDVTGKVVLIMNNDPAWDPDLFAGETRLWYGRWDYKYLTAAKNGAVGAIIIHTVPSAGYPFQVVQTSWTGEQFELPAGDEPRAQVEAWVTEDSAKALTQLGGHDLDELRAAADNRDFEPVPLGVTTSMVMDVSLNRVETANVLGLIPGSDPELQDEAVIYTAHHDHLGVGTPDASG
ncbi:MAG TPA: PA domain-containing protein, partial [Woeseiaceae bacterium]|nr:PA domain-containing protein [Woeseiaceae bacterium]